MVQFIIHPTKSTYQDYEVDNLPIYELSFIKKESLIVTTRPIILEITFDRLPLVTTPLSPRPRQKVVLTTFINNTGTFTLVPTLFLSTVSPVADTQIVL